jgi:hypothetical protein
VVALARPKVGAATWMVDSPPERIAAEAAHVQHVVARIFVAAPFIFDRAV